MTPPIKTAVGNYDSDEELLRAVHAGEAMVVPWYVGLWHALPYLALLKAQCFHQTAKQGIERLEDAIIFQQIYREAIGLKKEGNN